MGLLALLFPGQGSQAVGMGKALCDASPAARAIFDEADAALGFSLSRLCFEGPEEELKLTANTQPAILTHSVAAWADLRARLSERLEGVAFAAGHSLGEYSANVAVGALPFAEAVRLVRARGTFMQEAVPPGEGAMAAIVGLAADEVEAACVEAAQGEVVAPANYNSPEQTVIAGAAAAVARASQACLARGAKRAIPLTVSAPFHCALMTPARERMRPLLEAADFGEARIPIVTNVDARAERSGSALREALVRQIDSPVRWVESVRQLAQAGVDRALEIGPGNVLAGLVKRIEKGIRVEGVMRRAAALLAAVLSAACATSRGPESPFDAAVQRAEARCQCRLGVTARHLESGRTYSHNGSSEFEAASVIKIAVLTEAMAAVRDGSVDLEARWDLTAEDKADGSGTLLLLDPGLNPTWNDLATLMIGPSDNTATNAWIARLSIERINARMESLGLPHIRLLAMLPAYARRDEEPSPWKGLHLGIITPDEVAEWMTRVARGELLDAESSRRIFEYLDKDPSRLRIARRFPSEALWAGKTGTMSGTRNDSGILRTKKGRFVLVVLTAETKAVEPLGPDHPAVLAIADLAKTIVDAWSAELPDITTKPE